MSKPLRTGYLGKIAGASTGVKVGTAGIALAIISGGFYWASKNNKLPNFLIRKSAPPANK
jgi:hypothetical protein